MKIQRFNDFVNEYKKFGEFEGALRFGDWSDFAKRLSATTQKGFTTIEELLDGLGMDKQTYDKVKRNMIDNWIDSVSKSLLHGISGVDLEIPEKGDVIFKDEKAQTRFIIVGGPGAATRSIMGDVNSTRGLGLWGYPSIVDAKSGKPVSRFMMDVPLSLDSKKQDALDELLQYIWVYVFYNDHLKKSKGLKLPKVLYRGIRVANLFDTPEIRAELDKIKNWGVEGEFKREKNTKMCTDVVINYILKNGLSKIADGNYLSFTGSRSIAEYFAHSEGIILKVDPKKVRVVTSPLTDEQFAEPNPATGKKEQEYIVMLPDDYKFERDDIIISSEEYLVGANSPLAVAFFGHDNKKAEYDFEHDGKKYHIETWYSWTSNTSGKLAYKIDGNWMDGIKQIKRDYGFDPTPTEKNLDKITNFQIKPKKSF
jgi:hypothetical protein